MKAKLVVSVEEYGDKMYHLSCPHLHVMITIDNLMVTNLGDRHILGRLFAEHQHLTGCICAKDIEERYCKAYD